MKTDIHFLSYLAQFFLEWETFQTKLIEREKNIFYIQYFFENNAFYEIMWKNTVEQDWPQMTIRRVRIACWIPKATDTHSEYIIVITFPLQQWLHERVSVLRWYEHYLSCWISAGQNVSELNVIKYFRILISCCHRILCRDVCCVVSVVLCCVVLCCVCCVVLRLCCVCCVVLCRVCCVCCVVCVVLCCVVSVSGRQ